MAVTGGGDHDFTIKKAMREKWQPYSSRSPSFLRKEVPRRGGGWMGIAVFPKQSLPRVGKVASGASRIGY